MNTPDFPVTPTRSIDRKLDALAKRIAAEKQPKIIEKPPTEGLTSTITTPRRAPAPICVLLGEAVAVLTKLYGVK